MMMRPGAPISAPTVPLPNAKFPSALASRMRNTAGAISQLSLGLGAVGRPAPLDPAGVDLNLDSFDLDDTVQVAAPAIASGWEKATGAAFAEVFWASLDGEGDAVFGSADQALMKSVFNPLLSDRRAEGGLFTPPAVTPEYVEQLRALVKCEEDTRQQRVEHFLSAAFSASEPGALFPSTWAPLHEVVGQRSLGANLVPRPDCLSRKDLFDLVATTPVSDRATEDGLRFRMYQFGSFDVRTTQAYGGPEVVGAVFSARAAAPSCAGQRVPKDELVAKVTEYVEASAPHFRSYIVAETVQGNMITTMKLPNGSVTWEENPASLEERNSLAKFIRSWDCTRGNKSAATVGDLETFKQEFESAESGSSHSVRKQYVQSAYNFARGCADRVDSGFGRKQAWKKNEKASLAKKEMSTRAKAERK